MLSQDVKIAANSSVNENHELPPCASLVLPAPTV